MGVLRKSLVSDFGEAELALHRAEDVRNLGAHFRLAAISGSRLFAPRDESAAFPVCEVSRPRRLFGDDTALASGRRIIPHPPFAAVQQIAKYYGVMYIRGRGHRVVDQFGFYAHTNMCLHAEVLLIAFLDLMRIRIAMFFLVLGGAGRVDDADIDNRTPVYLQPIILEVLIDQVKRLVAQIVIVALHKVSEFSNGGFIGHGRIFSQVDAPELSHGSRVIGRFLGSGVRQVQSVLQEMDTQYSRNTGRTMPRPLRLGVEGFNSVAQFFTGNDGLHLLQKLFLTGLVGKFLESVGERCLFHTIHNRDQGNDCVIAELAN